MTTFAGDSFAVNASVLDFQKKLWFPIGYSDSKSFQGTMDFGDVTIRNLTTNGYYEGYEYSDDKLNKDYVGLFGYTKNASFKGNIKFEKDDSTPQEGAHIQCLGSYAGAFIGYALNTKIDESSVIVSNLNVQGTGGYIGGIIGAYELDNTLIPFAAQSETTYYLGSMQNSGNTNLVVEGSNVGGVAGVIGSIKVTSSSPVKLVASNLTNSGMVSNAVGNTAGVIAEIFGDNCEFTIDNLINASNISNAASNLGGIIGYAEGTLIVKKVVLDNGKENSPIALINRNVKSNIGSIIGQANDVILYEVELDPDGIQIQSDNLINYAQNEYYTGAIGGLIGQVNNLKFVKTEETKNRPIVVSDIVFATSGRTNYMGGIVGKVTDTLEFDYSDDKLHCRYFDISNITIKGVGYLGGVAGYVKTLVEKHDANDFANAITISNVTIEETTDTKDNYYKELLENESI